MAFKPRIMSLGNISFPIFFGICLFGFSSSFLLQAQAPSMAQVDIDSLLKALDVIAQNPEAVRSELDRARRDAEKQKEDKKQEIESLERRIELLHRASLLIGETKSPATNPSATSTRPVHENKAEGKKSDKPVARIPKATASGNPSSPFGEELQLTFARRFEKELWPLMKEGEKNCYSCHGKQTQTPMELPENGNEAFLKLLRENYFDSENPVSLLAKISSPSEKTRMPQPPSPAWGEKKIALVRSFQNDLFDARRSDQSKADEQFPAELNKPFGGPLVRLLAHGTTKRDNTFLTYHQLRRKVWAIFHDDWNRDERDLFDHNLALFSGADFQKRFDESSKPSAAFLAGLDLMAADVVSKSYLNLTGPFEGRPGEFGSPLEMKQPDAAYRHTIERLYRKILFRDPTDSELREAFEFVRNVHATSKKSGPLESGNSVLNFEVTVTGKEGVATTRNISISVRNDGHGLAQEIVNENQGSPGWIWRERVGEKFRLNKGDDAQRFIITNQNSRGRVILSGVEIVGPLPERTSRTVAVDDPKARLRGPWRLQDKGKVKFIDDGDDNKGECSADLPLAVDRDGEYEIYLKWLKPKKATMAANVRVEVAADAQTRLVNPPLAEAPPSGEARFVMDETLDTIPHRDLKTSFRFASDQEFVEINNAGTTKRVTADAVRFVPADGGAPIVIDNDEAEGKEDWPIFTDYPFRPYNIYGENSVSDQNKRKGQIRIRFKPSAHKQEWSKDKFYRVQVIYPGQENNETHVPVIVKASASSPIVNLSYPDHAPPGADVELDASASYDLQGSALRYEWRQIGGAEVRFDDSHAAKVKFRVAAPNPTQRAWEGLARVLINHPDFVFTRPVSLEGKLEPEARNRLLLVKIAQDLVARPPTPEEIAKIESGTSLSRMIDEYLAGKEFEEFYFHRIRLYLESHGSDVEDEPVRLWCHVAFENRPFEEILTADYTVNKGMKTEPRPAYYGKTGLLTMKGFIQGKPGLPHFNYPAQVAEKFLGYVFEVPPEIVAQREGITAVSTTNPSTVCYSCHKILTPLAYQRLDWDDAGNYRTHDDRGLALDASDQGLVPSYSFRGEGLEAFAQAARKKERFIRTMIDTHFAFYFGRGMRCEGTERGLYRRLWDKVHEQNFSIKGLIKAIMTSPEYLGEEAGTQKGARYATASVP